MAKRKQLAPEDMKAKKKKFENIADNLEVISVEDFLKNNFLPYAWSTTLDRALSDVTGLKPVQRRILYTMYKNNLSPNASRSKVATLGGKVLAYHPHGDASVNDALKNLAREHIFRVPLIDGKGDFGVPGTPGAAPRYIEARLNAAAWLNLEEIADNAVNMVPNYDNTTTEPMKLPVKWPVSIINGGSGIATGYASKMPSHNPTEVMKAAKLMLRDPDTTDAALQKVILGPDFNMGGMITSHDGIKEYLETGSGSFKIRGQYEVTHGPRNTARIEFYEIPYGTNPEEIIDNIKKAIDDKGQLKDIASYKDLSDLTHPIRVIVETKPSTNHKKVIQDLFKYTNLESSFSANITTIVDNRPVRSSMKDLLLDFIKFRKLCVANKSKYALAKKNDRVHLIDGLIKALLDIDKAIAIIRKSETTTEASAGLQKSFKIDEKQAEHILSLQLRRLTKMDSQEIENEKTKLEEEAAYLKSLLTDEDVLKEHLLKEFDATLKVIGDERKTDINSVSAEEFAQEQKMLATELKAADKNLPCFVTRFANGTIMKTLEEFAYDSQRAKKLIHTPIVEQMKMMTQDVIVIVDSSGIGHKVPLSYLPEGKASAAKNAGLNLSSGVRLVGMSKYELGKGDVGLAIGTKNGSVKISKADYPKSDEFPVISLDEGDEIIDTRWLDKNFANSHFAFVSQAGNILMFDATTVRAAGHKAGGVRGMKLKGPDDAVIHFTWINPESNKDGITVSTYSKKTIKATLLAEIPIKGKGGMGVATQSFKSGEVALKNAYVGSGAIACTDGPMKTAVSLPPVTKRTQRGMDFNIDVIFGTMETISV